MAVPQITLDEEQALTNIAIVYVYHGAPARIAS